MYKIGAVSSLQYLGGVQSSFTMSRLNLNVQKYQMSFVSAVPWWRSNIYHHVQAKSECTKFEVSFWSAVPGWSSIIFHHVQAKSECTKFEVSFWSAVPGSKSIIFHHVQAKCECKKFQVRFWSAVPEGGQSSFTMSRLNLKLKKNFGETLVCISRVKFNHLLPCAG